jgi:hypothetical protein
MIIHYHTISKKTSVEFKGELVY